MTPPTPPTARSTTPPPTIPHLDDLPAMEVPPRIGALRARLGEAGCDALLVTDLVNIRYLTGFTGSAARLLVTPEALVFATDGRYRDQSEAELAAAGVEAEIVVASDPRESLAEAASGCARLGLEADHVTWSAQRRYAEEWFPEAELVATTRLVADLRLIKDEGEVARISAAASIADAALAEVRHRLAEGPTEAEFALELDTAMRRLGATGPSFDTICASGPNAARPHHRPGPRQIVEGDLVVCDFGALIDGYASDMSRSFAIGEPDATQARMLEVVTDAQAIGVRAVSAESACADIDAACRDHIAEAGWEDAFLHSTGHGVGLFIHEDPRVASTSDATLAAGNVVTVEPGVYLADHGGVRVEDTVVVTADGCTTLTRAPKDPAP